MKSIKMLMMGRLPAPTTTNGLLYNGFAAQNILILNSGWSVPSVAQWDILMNYVGDAGTAGGFLKETGLTHWTTPNTSATDDYGFKALGSGYRNSAGTFENIFNNFQAFDNLSTVGDSGTTEMLYNSDNMGTGLLRSDTDGSSIRGLYTGGTTPPSRIQDYDGNTYDVVHIGTQYWLAQNWACTHLRDGTALTEVTLAATWAGATAGNYYYCAYDNDNGNINA